MTGRSAHWAHWLLIPGIPILIAGQLWTVALQMSCVRALTAATPPRAWWRRRYSQMDIVRALFVGDSSTAERVLFFTAEAAAAVTAATSDPVFHWFHPSPQRFAAGVFMGFYAAHAAACSAEIARRRAEQLTRGGYSTM